VLVHDPSCSARASLAGGGGVCEACRGEDSDSFVQIARQLSHCATAVLYDRPGTGSSGPRSEPVVLASTVP